MSTVAYNSIELAGTVGSFSGGLGGAPTDMRSVWKAKPTRIKFSFVQGASQGNVGDTITIATLPPTAWVYDWMFANGVGSWTSVTIAISKIDGNSLVLSAGYFAPAFSVATIGTFRATGSGASANPLPIVVGPDPLGDDSSAAQGIPNYGSAFSIVELVVAGAGIPAGGTINGYLDVVIGN